MAVNDGRSVVILDHDRAGPSAVVLRLTAACDPAGAVQMPSPAPGVRRYKRAGLGTGEFMATWYDLFPGGLSDLPTALHQRRQGVVRR